MKKILLVTLSLLMISNIPLSSYAEEVKKEIVVTEKISNNKSIAILDFENNTGIVSHDNLKKALADTLTNGLSKYQSLTIVERTRLKDAMNELKLGQSGFISQESAVKIGKTAGSQYVILGSLSKIGDTFEISLRLVDIESSKIISAKSIRCFEEEMFLKAIDYLSMETADSLGEKVNKSEIMSRLKNDIENYKKNSMNWLLWTGIGALVLAGAGTGVYFFIKNNEKKVVVNNPKQQTCIPPNCKPIINQPILNQPIIKKFSVGLDGINFNFDF